METLSLDPGCVRLTWQLLLLQNAGSMHCYQFRTFWCGTMGELRLVNIL